MRARIADLATPRRLVGAECCATLVVAATAIVILGAPSLLALGALAICALTTTPALVVVGRLERRGGRD
jgi:hypothetical protein